MSRRSTVGAATVLAILWSAPALFAADPLQPAPYTLGRGDEFGSALAVGDGVVAVGAYLSAAGGGAESGAVYVFRRDSVPPWSGPALLCGAPGDWFGFDAAIDGRQLLVGAPRARDGSGAQTGAAYMYDLDDPPLKAPSPGQPCVPKPTPLMLAGGAGDEIGSAVALSGACWAVGARGDGSQAVAGAGSVYVYCPPGQPQQPAPPPKLYPHPPTDGAHFGQSVSLDGCSTKRGCILAVGAPFAGVGGAAYVFAGPTGWQPTQLPAAAVPAGAAFGYAVAVSANQVVVGAPLDNDNGEGAMAGAAYLYSQSNGTWLPKPLDAGSPHAGAQFGVAVAFDRLGQGEIIVGARLANNGAGAAYLFGSDGLPARGSPMLSPPPDKPGAEFGFEVAIDDGTMVVGAFLQDMGAGAAYLFPPATTANVTVTKTTAPGSVAAPGSVLVYSISATDASGLGIGGLQLTDKVPDQTSFAASSLNAGWSCVTTGSGNLCTLPVGNLSPGGTATRFFAVRIAAPLPAGVTSIANTACAWQGPSRRLGCGSTSTPTTGAPMLELAQTLQSGTGTPGAALVYQLVVSNTGTQDSVPVTVQETVPANTAWNAANSRGWSCGGSAAGSSCTQSLGIVPAGSSTISQFAVTLANPLPAGVTSVANVACFAGTQICKSLTTPTRGIPALKVHESLSGSATPGAALTYTVTVEDTGNEGASSVVVTDQVPQYATFQRAGSSPTWSCTPDTSAGSTCTAALGIVPAGATVSLAFAVEVVNPLPAGAATIANTACAGARGTPGAAPACDEVTTPLLGQPQLVLAKQYTGCPAMPSAVLIFTLQLSNTGDRDAGAVTLHETVPAHATFNAGASSPLWSCAATTPGSACTLAVGGLAAGATLYATFAVTADASLLPATVIDNSACATTGGGAPVCADAETPAQAPPTPVPPTPPLHFYTLIQCRALDTRRTGAPLTQFNRQQVYQLSGVCGVPASAVAVAVNVTLVGPNTDLSVKGYPGDLAPPCVAETVFAPVHGFDPVHRAIAGFAVLRLATSGAGTLGFLMTIAPPAASGQTDLLLDLSGYFAP